MANGNDYGWWWEEAACIGKPLDYFFPDVEPHDKAKAPFVYGLAVCRNCPVRDACLDDAMRAEKDARWRFGVFGGLTPHERWLYDPAWREGRAHGQW